MSLTLPCSSSHFLPFISPLSFCFYCLHSLLITDPLLCLNSFSLSLHFYTLCTKVGRKCLPDEPGQQPGWVGYLHFWWIYTNHRSKRNPWFGLDNPWPQLGVTVYLLARTVQWRRLEILICLRVWASSFYPGEPSMCQGWSMSNGSFEEPPLAEAILIGTLANPRTFSGICFFLLKVWSCKNKSVLKSFSS